MDALEGLQKLMLPDRWQAEAIQWLKSGSDVVIDAPTGAGKTYVFECWAEQTNFGRRALFTVPTRALANDKYAEWQTRGWSVGIMTGDVTIAPDSPVVVATLEAVQGCFQPDVVRLRPTPDSRAPEASGSRGGDAFQMLVVDEYHWLANPERGNHYEGVLLSLPPTVQLLLLSGAVANPEEVVAWLRRLGRQVELVRHRERPVPLEEVDADDLIHGLPRGIEGFWSRRVAGALREGLGPVLGVCPAPAGRGAAGPAIRARTAAGRSARPHAGAGEPRGPGPDQAGAAARGLSSQRPQLWAARRRDRAAGQGRAAPRGRRHAGPQRRHQLFAPLGAHHGAQLSFQSTRA